MLIPLQEKDLNQYVDFVYELVLDPARTFYPVFFDGIKTKEDFIARVRKAFSRPEDEILLCQVNGTVEGWLHYFHLPGDRQIQLYTRYIRRDTAVALEELSGYLAERYPGCDWMIGFPAGNREAEAWAEGAGLRKFDDTYNYSSVLDRYAPVPDDPSVERITEENFEKFQRVHRACDQGLFDNWRYAQQRGIFFARQGKFSQAS